MPERSGFGSKTDNEVGGCDRAVKSGKSVRVG